MNFKIDLLVSSLGICNLKLAMHQFRKLTVWEKSMDLTTSVYNVTKSFPKEEMYGLTQQLRRAAVSIPSNIAEGAYRNSNKEFNHFLGISAGSAGEVFTQLEIAKRLNYIKPLIAENLMAESDSIKRMIYNFQQYLKTKSRSPN